MKLIADSGSTKTEWCVMHENGTCDRIITSGINPFYQSTQDIINSLQKEFQLETVIIEEIFFYGAGCANSEKNKIVADALVHYFNCQQVTIESDLMGAAHALCQSEAGIACILGTGSNSCHYDGSTIIKNVSPLGFILGDEGSGAVMGKRLMADVLKHQLSDASIELFFDTYQTTPAEILDRVYKQPFPNRYLAQFTKFLSQNIRVAELEDLVLNCLNEFVIRNLLQYSNKDLKVFFTGSIAYYFREQLEKVMEKNGLKIGVINQAPMEGLIEYHNKPRQ